ncbi:MAG: Uma2 family endonuclease [Bernardetiaceae bacterium]
MPTFLLHIEKPEHLTLFRQLTQALGISWQLHPEARYYTPKAHYTPEDIAAIVAQFPQDHPWTFSDLNDERIFPVSHVKKQLLDNQLYIMPNPSTLHQKILNLVATYLTLFVQENKLGSVYVAPVSIKIDENNALEPDVIYISLAKADGVGQQAIHVAPELVVEVISPANYKKLREEKKAKYAAFGVQEYWEIYPKKQAIRVETLTYNEDSQENEYCLYDQAEKTGSIRSQVLDGFTLEVERVFFL